MNGTSKTTLSLAAIETMMRVVLHDWCTEQMLPAIDVDDMDAWLIDPSLSTDHQRAVVGSFYRTMRDVRRTSSLVTFNDLLAWPIIVSEGVSVSR